jgi:hypothetical protein
MSPGSDPWRLSSPLELNARMRRWFERSRQLGIHHDFVATLRQIHTALQTDPLQWGDPVHRLRHLSLLVCHRIHRMIHTTYGVHEARRIVFIRTMSILPPHPLADES